MRVYYLLAVGVTDLIVSMRMYYLVVVGFTVGEALALVVPMSQEGFLTLSTHKMLQTKPTAEAHLVNTNITTHCGSIPQPSASG